jgi:hypothetical protein
MGWGLTDEVRAAVDRALDVVSETIDELRSEAAAAPE